ncbi:MAG: DUF3568 family protein [Phycisphaeraceae bacterium]|nr:MAG: DUF3568 family protein [Phycisphaeraceae bacterium]
MYEHGAGVRGWTTGRRRLAGAAACAGVIAWALAGAGCVADPVTISAGLSAAQQGTAAFFKGELQAAFRVPMDRVEWAVRAALEELDFPVENTSPSEEGWVEINAREESGRLVTVTLRRHSRVVTSIRVRVGLFGDQALSRLVLNKVQMGLGLNQGESGGGGAAESM